MSGMDQGPVLEVVMTIDSTDQLHLEGSYKRGALRVSRDNSALYIRSDLVAEDIATAAKAATLAERDRVLGILRRLNDALEASASVDGAINRAVYQVALDPEVGKEGAR
ncbi:MAG: hypothetical protein AAGM38_09865 [Pseudomonadota bacterium]